MVPKHIRPAPTHLRRDLVVLHLVRALGAIALALATALDSVVDRDFTGVDVVTRVHWARTTLCPH